MALAAPVLSEGSLQLYDYQDFVKRTGSGSHGFPRPGSSPRESTPLPLPAPNPRERITSSVPFSPGRGSPLPRPARAEAGDDGWRRSSPGNQGRQKATSPSLAPSSPFGTSSPAAMSPFTPASSSSSQPGTPKGKGKPLPLPTPPGAKGGGFPRPALAVSLHGLSPGSSPMRGTPKTPLAGCTPRSCAKPVPLPKPPSRPSSRSSPGTSGWGDGSPAKLTPSRVGKQPYFSRYANASAGGGDSGASAARQPQQQQHAPRIVELHALPRPPGAAEQSR